MSTTAIKERPILFSGPMVRAILDGRKTQTRRIVKPQPHDEWRPDHYDEIHKMIDGDFPTRNGLPITIGWGALNDEGDWGIVCPYGKPGERLWVRETWAHTTDEKRGWNENSPHGSWPIYRATERQWEVDRWKPSIFMPRWASRLTLEITDVRIERLQEISNEDARAEGVMPGYAHEATYAVPTGHPYNAIPLFKNLWSLINGADSWNTNPWVWVVSFRRVVE
jgi:hypothetical protein